MCEVSGSGAGGQAPEPGAERMSVDEYKRQTEALGKTAALHDVLETKGVSNEERKPCKNLYY